MPKISSFNRCRERARRKRALLLKECVSTTFRDRSYGKKLSDPRNADLKGTGLVLAQKKKPNRLNKGVWRGVINTFMRNGSKLRYQTVLRNALLEP